MIFSIVDYKINDEVHLTKTVSLNDYKHQPVAFTATLLATLQVVDDKIFNDVKLLRIYKKNGNAFYVEINNHLLQIDTGVYKTETLTKSQLLSLFKFDHKDAIEMFFAMDINPYRYPTTTDNIKFTHIVDY